MLLSKITIAEIAQLANVSKTTVSRVLNNKPDVQPETRDKIKKIIAEYDYHPNAFAKAILNKKSNSIGLLIPYDANYIFSNPFYYEIIRGISQAANKNGYFLMFCYSEGDNYITAIKEKRIDGIILISPGSGHKGIIDRIRELDMPLVSTSKIPGVKDIRYVDVDNVHGARMAVEHLVSLGHRRIGFINGPSVLASSEDRLKGYCSVLSDHGIPYDANLVRIGDTSIGSGHKAMESLLNTQDISAVFVASDLMAVGVIGAINEHGKNVPNDISVVGFDDIPLAGALNPPLTTIRQFAYEKGAVATDMLIKLIGKDSEEQMPRIEAEIIVRYSTKKV